MEQLKGGETVSDLGWADHEEVVGELKDALKDIEALANEALDDTPVDLATNTDYGHLRRKLTKIWERARGVL